MFKINSGEYIIQCQSNGLPITINEYSKHAVLAESFDIEKSVGTACFISIGKNNQWPFLVIAQRSDP
jgi:hypothetical protein